MDITTKALIIESALRNLTDTENQYASLLKNDLYQTISNELNSYKKYGGNIEEKINAFMHEYKDLKNKDLDYLAEEAVLTMNKMINDIAKLINEYEGRTI